MTAWYFRDESTGSHEGPYGLSTLLRMLRDGKITPETKVTNSEIEGWKAFSEVAPTGQPVSESDFGAQETGKQRFDSSSGGSQGEWYIQRKNRRDPEGQFSLDDLVRMYEAGEISAGTLVTNPELGDWKQLHEVEEITERTGFIPPPPPGSSSHTTTSGDQFAATGTADSATGGYPPQIRQLTWNWGAFWLAFFWGISHKNWWSLTLIVPYLNVIAVIPVTLYYGFKGHQIAWDSGRFETAEECIECQRAWSNWGWALIVIQVFLAIVLVAASTA